jgi:hypothetical protein
VSPYQSEPSKITKIKNKLEITTAIQNQSGVPFFIQSGISSVLGAIF